MGDKKKRLEYTFVNDSFPFQELECVYQGICRWYEPGSCSYIQGCDTKAVLKQVVDDGIPKKNLEMQLKDINEQVLKKYKKQDGRQKK